MSKREKGRTGWETENERVKEKYKNTTIEGEFENEEERVRGIKGRKREKRIKKRNKDIHSEHVFI
jgi:translation initiation factor IF-1